MAEGGKKRALGLGRGLSALLGEDRGEAATERPRSLRHLPIEVLVPNNSQPRRRFDEAALEELVASIRGHGILQPLVVRQIGTEPERFEIIAGERRWRAAQRASCHEVPVVVKDFSDNQVLQVALVENIQRQNLTPIEEARAFRRLIDEFGHTQEVLAGALGKSRSHIANMLRLLTLPNIVQGMIDEGGLSMGHARALVTADDPLGMARKIVDGGLSVRAAEGLVRAAREGTSPPPRKGKPQPVKAADTLALEADLSAAVGLRVSIEDRRQKGGEVRIAYSTLDQLDDICQRLCHGTPISEG